MDKSYISMKKTSTAFIIQNKICCNKTKPKYKYMQKYSHAVVK